MTMTRPREEPFAGQGAPAHAHVAHQFVEPVPRPHLAARLLRLIEPAELDPGPPARRRIVHSAGDIVGDQPLEMVAQLHVEALVRGTPSAIAHDAGSRSAVLTIS